MDLFKLMPYFLVIISLFFIVLALSVFIRKKPLILNSVWFLVGICLCFLFPILSSFETILEEPSFIGILPALLFVVMIVFSAFMMKGYTIYGVDGSAFQKSFTECLTDNNYEFEQSLSTIKIKNPELELSIALQSWTGTVQLRWKGKANREVLKKLMSDLKKKDIKANYIVPILYAIIGVGMLIFSIVMIINVSQYALN